jgi:hypothetical protein
MGVGITEMSALKTIVNVGRAVNSGMEVINGLIVIGFVGYAAVAGLKAGVKAGYAGVTGKSPKKRRLSDAVREFEDELVEEKVEV